MMGDLDRVDFKVLRAVAEYDGVRPAAQVLKYSPSTISRRIQAMSTRLGFPLTEQIDGHTVLTEAGRRLVHLAIEMENEWTDAVHGLQDHAFAEARDVVRLAAFSSAIEFSVADAVKLLQQTTPIVPYLTAIEPDVAQEFLQLGKVDAAVSVSAFQNHRDDSIKTYPLWRERFVLAAPENVRLSPSPDAMELALARTSWILPPSGTVWEKLVNRFFERVNIRPRIVGRSDEWSLMQQMAARLDTATLVPVTTFSGGNGVQVVPIDHSILPSRTVTLNVTNGRNWLPTVFQALCHAARASAHAFDKRLISLADSLNKGRGGAGL
jgi:DNA-binding transcriptional LysR family regulator